MCSSRSADALQPSGSPAVADGETWRGPGVPVSVVFGCTGRRCGLRGVWLKSKSLREVAEDRDVLADVGRGSGRPSVRGSRRWPPRKSSSMNLS